MDLGERTDAHGPALPRLARWARRKWPVAALVVLLAAGVAGAATWAVMRYTHPPTLIGAVVTPPIVAPDFQLPDQDGRMVSLASLRGKAVALTFLYTHCPDVCPLIADMMHKTYGRLGGMTTRVAFVAVSVDPRGDTPEAIRAFLATHHVEHELIYLRGTFAQTREVWARYYVGSDAKEVNPEAVRVGPPSPDLVAHSAIVYVIDPKGVIRVILPGNFDPQDLATDLRLLAS